MEKKPINTAFRLIDSFLAAFSPSEANLPSVIDYFVPMVDEDVLKVTLGYYASYLKEPKDELIPYFDPLYTLMAHYSGTLDGKMESTIRRIGRDWWKYIQPFISNPQKVVDKIGEKKPKAKVMLSGTVGQAYMKYYTKRLTDFFYIFLWRFPKWHNGCGGLIRYGLIQKKGNVWGFYCRKCGVQIPQEQLDDLTYTKKLLQKKK